MSPNEPNPYAPTELHDSKPIYPSSGRSMGVAVAIVIGFVGWLVFIAVLMNSPPDRVAAFLMLINAPFLFGLMIAAGRRSNNRAYVFGFLAAGMQVLIMLGMLFGLPGGDVTAIIGINSGIIVVILTLAFAARHVFVRNSQIANETTDQTTENFWVR